MRVSWVSRTRAVTRTRLPPSRRSSGSSRPTPTASETEAVAASTETGSVKALSISRTRLRGPATRTSPGSLATPAISKPVAGRPIRRGRTGICLRSVRSRLRVSSDGVILTTRKPKGTWILSEVSWTMRSPSTAPARSIVARSLPASRLLIRPGEARTRTSTAFTGSPVSSRSRGTLRSSTGTPTPRSAVCLPAITNHRPAASARLASRSDTSAWKGFTFAPGWRQRPEPGRPQPPAARARPAGPGAVPVRRARGECGRPRPAR